MKVLFSHLRSEGFTSVAYIDDSLLVENSYHRCLCNINATVNLFQQADFAINYCKSVLKPVLYIEFLGFRFNSRVCKLSLSDAKLQKLSQLAFGISNSQHLVIGKLAKVIRIIISVLPVFLTGKLHYQSLEGCKVQTLFIHRGNFDNRSVLSKDALIELSYWSHRAYKDVGVPIRDGRSVELEVQSI